MADPFFETIQDGEWNACIGIQGEEFNYVAGYLEAAQILAETVIDRKLTGSRDTLAMPILYNVRHGLELALKYVLRAFVDFGMAKPREGQADHNILAYWEHLKAQSVGDRASREQIDALAPFVTSLFQIDENGQELRYFETQDGERSLNDLAVVNLPLIRKSVEQLSDILDHLTDRVSRLAQEHATKTHTRRCSRTDLHEIANIVGDRASWREDSFLVRKAEAMSRFGLSNGALSDALKAIEESRELAVSIGIETPLTYLTDGKATQVVARWLETNPPMPADSEPMIIAGDELDIDEILQHGQKAGALNEAVVQLLSLEEFADLQTVFYVGRNGEFGEEYEAALELTLQGHRLRDDRLALVGHIMSKTNFLDGLVRGLRRVGRPSLAYQIARMRQAALLQAQSV